MKGILGLSADFFERMANPEAGIEVNEDYAMRLATLLHDDDNLVGILVEAQSELTGEDVGLMSATAWLAFINLLRSTGHRPTDRLMTALYDQAFDSLLRYRMVEIAVTDPSVNEQITQGSTRRAGIEKFPDRWLTSRMLAAVSGVTKDGVVPPDERVGLAFNLVQILVQIGTVAAIEAAAALLGYPWEYQEGLRTRTETLLTGLPDEDSAAWYERLGLGERRLRG